MEHFRRVQAPVASFVCALALSLTACGSIGPSPSAITSANAVVSRSPTATLPDVSRSHEGPTYVSAEGTGTREIALTGVPRGSGIAIRFACGGTTGVELTDLSGKLLMGVSGCDGSSIYGSEFKSSSKDDVIRIGVAPDVTWVIAVWVQLP